MKKLFLVMVAVVMMFSSINVFSEQMETKYNTSISGDITLNFNDDWQPYFTFATQKTIMSQVGINIQVLADVNIKGNTDADSLIIYSEGSPSAKEEIIIDSNGDFDQNVKLNLDKIYDTELNTINFSAYVEATKGDRTVKVKIGKGELKTDFFTDVIKAIKQDYNGSINAVVIAEIMRTFSEPFIAEYNDMDDQESINAYIYNEWYMRDYVIGEENISYTAQTHLRANTDAEKITLNITNSENTEKYEYSSDSVDTIEEFTGVVPLNQSSDVAANASAKVYKGNRQIELLSCLRGQKSGDAVVGDLDGDKVVNAIDFMIMRKYLLGQIDRFPTEDGFYSADVNDDKVDDIIDFAQIRQYLLGMIAYFPKESDKINPSIPVTPTPSIDTITPVKETPDYSSGMVTYYNVNGYDVSGNHGVEIYIEKSPENKIRVSASTVCKGPLFADGWEKTYFRLAGSAVNGVDYEKIDFDYFWRVVGSDIFVPPLDDNPKYGFDIIPIDTGSDEPKELEIYFGHSTEPAAIIHLTKNLVTPVPATPKPPLSIPGGT